MQGLISSDQIVDQIIYHIRKHCRNEFCNRVRQFQHPDHEEQPDSRAIEPLDMYG